LLSGGVLALVGIIPALALTWGQPADIVAEANRIYVFERLAHHLALLTLPREETTHRLLCHAILLLSLWLLARVNERTVASSADRSGLRPIARFAWMAASVAALGLVIEFAFWADRLSAAAWQRYYWYRLTDFAAPLAASLVITSLVADGLGGRRPHGRWWLAAALAVTTTFLASVTWQRIESFSPPADRRLRDPIAWREVCDWIADHTEPDALFLTPRTNQTFKWHAGRAEVVTRKDIPQDAASVVEWFRRYREIHFIDPRWGSTIEPVRSLGHLGTERILQLSAEYDVDYVVTGWRQPLWLPVVYPNVAYANEEYAVYRVPEREEK
jgi:hypothetical protein